TKILFIVKHSCILFEYLRIMINKEIKFGFQVKNSKSKLNLLKASNKILDQRTKRHKDSEKKELIIPLIKVNRYKFENLDQSKIESSPKQIKTRTSLSQSQKNNRNNYGSDELNSPENDLITKAKQELLQEFKNQKDRIETETIPAWKSLMINKMPSEFENDSKCDVSMRPEEPKLEDYEQIPIEAYGHAMLRGMGWKEGDAIGGINKAVTPIIEPQLRPRGLGLGADISLKQQLEGNNDRKNGQTSSPSLSIRRNCHVAVEIGPYKGLYGTVINISDDLIYADVRMAIGSEIISLPQAILKVVTKKEFDSDGKVINKNKFDAYKNREKQQQSSKSEKKLEGEKMISGAKNHIINRDQNDKIWIVPGILAQIIDKNFKEGKYYKEKVVILKTIGDECVVKTKVNKILCLSQSMLRTVIPSSSSTNSMPKVLIVLGKFRGQTARIKEINHKRNEALVRLIDTENSVSISLDSISELAEN
ncbi:G-patch domain and KOW motifs-containing protein, partial [Sarcoptes scabiei]